MKVETHKNVPPGQVMDGCVAVYEAAFGAPPYGESAGQAQLLRERVVSYAGRDGFRLPVAFEADGTPAGFGLGVIAHPGDWWRDQVASVIGPQAEARWLAEACLEIVHVAVTPGQQRRGVGRRLMDALLAPPRPGTGVLSCHPAATAAQRFYQSQGWQLITEEFRTRPGQLAFWLMGKDLPSPEVTRRRLPLARRAASAVPAGSPGPRC